jgi:hypothetical protein
MTNSGHPRFSEQSAVGWITSTARPVAIPKVRAVCLTGETNTEPQPLAFRFTTLGPLTSEASGMELGFVFYQDSHALGQVSDTADQPAFKVLGPPWTPSFFEPALIVALTLRVLTTSTRVSGTTFA